jgi:cyclopropane fatty-acyl-phospholipid synthase-like methyltransferase
MRPAWWFDEHASAGVDYASQEEAVAYDVMHQRLRRYDEEVAAIIEALGLGPKSTVIDMGAGTGAFAVHAAPHVKQVFAVDVSAPMLARCREKARSAGLRNVRCRAGGFLTYRHTGAPADAVVSVAALHHLPDFWKLVGLRRVREMLKQGGKLFLFDIVFPSSAPDLDRQLQVWVRAIKAKAGARLAKEAEVHLRSEHSTYDWVMDGLLRRAGFRITRKQTGEGFRTTYVCTRL